MHTDGEDEREQDGSEDRGELPQRQNTDQKPGRREHDDQTTRHQPARLGSSSTRISHTATVPPGYPSRLLRNR